MDDLLGKYPVFHEMLSIDDISKYKKHLESTINIEKSAKQYMNYLSMYLQSCQSLEVAWSDIESVRKFIENIHNEDIFVPTVLWSVSSAISSLFICLHNHIEILEVDKSLGKYLKKWSDEYCPKRAKTHSEKDIILWLLLLLLLKTADAPLWKKCCYVIQLCSLGRKIEVTFMPCFMTFQDVGN